MHPRRYETLLLLDPDLSTEEQEQITQKISDIMGKMGGQMIRLDDWGRRRLAYPVKKQMYGHYLLMDFMGSPELLSELERNLRIDEGVFKFLTQLLDKNFSEEKYTEELERQAAEQARREAERTRREAEMEERASADSIQTAGGEDEESDDEEQEQEALPEADAAAEVAEPQPAETAPETETKPQPAETAPETETEPQPAETAPETETQAEAASDLEAGEKNESTS